MFPKSRSAEKVTSSLQLTTKGLELWNIEKASLPCCVLTVGQHLRSQFFYRSVSVFFQRSMPALVMMAAIKSVTGGGAIAWHVTVTLGISLGVTAKLVKVM